MITNNSKAYVAGYLTGTIMRIAVTIGLLVYAVLSVEDIKDSLRQLAPNSCQLQLPRD